MMNMNVKKKSTVNEDLWDSFYGPKNQKYFVNDPTFFFCRR